MDGPGEVTRLLHLFRLGDAGARNSLFELIYADLKKIARAQLRNEHRAYSLQPTALVNETFLKMAGVGLDCDGRGQLMAILSQVMRRILIDHARARNAEKRGAAFEAVQLDDGVAGVLPQPDQLLALNDALDQLQRLDPRTSRVVEMRYFGGCTEEETAAALGLSRQTVTREWRFARMFLLDAMEGWPR